MLSGALLSWSFHPWAPGPRLFFLGGAFAWAGRFPPRAFRPISSFCISKPPRTARNNGIWAVGHVRASVANHSPDSRIAVSRREVREVGASCGEAWVLIEWLQFKPCPNTATPYLHLVGSTAGGEQIYMIDELTHILLAIRLATRYV